MITPSGVAAAPRFFTVAAKLTGAPATTFGTATDVTTRSGNSAADALGADTDDHAVPTDNANSGAAIAASSRTVFDVVPNTVPDSSAAGAPALLAANRADDVRANVAARPPARYRALPHRRIRDD
jgi:hypothetical protein